METHEPGGGSRGSSTPADPAPIVEPTGEPDVATDVDGDDTMADPTVEPTVEPDAPAEAKGDTVTMSKADLDSLIDARIRAATGGVTVAPAFAEEDKPKAPEEKQSAALLALLLDRTTFNDEQEAAYARALLSGDATAIHERGSVEAWPSDDDEDVAV